MTNTTFKPAYERWRHGGWYVSNVTYPSGDCGCVSNNYDDKKWRIVCDRRDGDMTYPSRDAAARAEHELAQREHEKWAPLLSTLNDPQLKYSAMSLFDDIDKDPHGDLDKMVECVLRLRPVDATALRNVGTRYRDHGLAPAICG